MSWFSKLQKGLGKTSSKISDGIRHVLVKKKLDDAALEELEELFILSDMGHKTASYVIETLRQEKFEKDIDEHALKHDIAEILSGVLTPVAVPMKDDFDHTPEIILMCGVNGTGKTTTIGKLASKYLQSGKRVAIGACDTFRAAAVEQLEVWADRVGAKIIKGEHGADPASVAYQTIEYAKAENVDVVFIDTAGRLENKSDLMEELKKIVRVIQKIDSSYPHQSLIVLDATTGQNAMRQVEVFKDTVGLTGVIVTKLDGTAKGGIVVQLAKAYELPIHAVGVGEQVDDLQGFDPKDFARNILGVSA